jgi:YD repeat-containing protein
VSNVVFKNGGTTRMTTSRTYDGFGRLTSISNLPSGGGGSVVSFNYAYNPANQRAAVTNSDNSRWDFGYDSLGQVTSGKKRWSDNAYVGGQQFEYQYDDIGNRRFYKWGGDTNGSNLRQTAYTVNLLNQNTARSNPGYAEILGEADSNATVKVNAQTAVRHDKYFWKELTANNSNAPVWLGVTNVAIQSTNATEETYVKVKMLMIVLLCSIFTSCKSNDSFYDKSGRVSISKVVKKYGMPDDAYSVGYGCFDMRYYDRRMCVYIDGYSNKVIVTIYAPTK